MGSIPGLGRSPGGGRDNLLQYPCLENPMDRDAWCATLHGVINGQTQLNDYFHFHFIQLGDQSLNITSALFLVLL